MPVTDVVHQFWYDTSSSPQLPPLARLSYMSFCANSGCEVVLWSYQKFAGVAVRDASSILKRSEFEQMLGNNHIAHVSDLFRCVLLSRFGGWWADMDCLCIRRLPQRKRAFATQPLKLTGAFKMKRQFQDPGLGRFTNAIMRVPRKDALMEQTIAWLRPRLNAGSVGKWTAVMLQMAHALTELGYERHVLPPVCLGPTRLCAVPPEKDTVKFGFLWPGLQSMRKHTCVLDMYGKKHSKILQMLSALDTRGVRCIGGDAERLLTGLVDERLQWSVSRPAL